MDLAHVSGAGRLLAAPQHNAALNTELLLKQVNARLRSRGAIVVGKKRHKGDGLYDHRAVCQMSLYLKREAAPRIRCPLSDLSQSPVASP